MDVTSPSDKNKATLIALLFRFVLEEWQYWKRKIFRLDRCYVWLDLPPPRWFMTRPCIFENGYQTGRHNRNNCYLIKFPNTYENLVLVAGLLTRGAMKLDDRPLWFDVYKAFPPISEPKFAKPKPEIKPIRQILYPEDVIRAKFHENRHGLATINIISQTDTQTKRLVQQYEKLKAEGVPEDELIEKAAQAVGSERQIESSKPRINAKKPESVTGQIIAEADLKNIFKE